MSDNPDLKAQFDRGYSDAYANRPAIYGCHIGMRSSLQLWRAAYLRGYEQGRLDRLSDIHENAKFDAMNKGDE